MDDKKHIVAITAFIKNKEGNKFLLLKRSDIETAFPGKWSFPGGKLEKGEDILETLKREVMEEAGLEIEDHKEFIKDFTFIRPDGHNVVGLCFLVKSKSEDVKINANDFQDFQWVTPDEFKNLDFIEGMEDEVMLAFQNNIKNFTAMKSFIVHNNKVLLLRESNKYQDGTNASKYDVVGGRVKPGQRFDESLLREIEEETKLKVRIGNPFCVDEWRPNVRGEQWHIIATFFECFSDSDKVILSQDHDGYLWINPKDYKNYNIIKTNWPAFEAYIKRSQ